MLLPDGPNAIDGTGMAQFILPNMSSYLKFWGKARGERNGEPATHPVAYHGLDVAAAADALLRANPRMLTRITASLGTTEDNARNCLVALIALHDIGKFAEAFQWNVPEAWPRDVLGGDWRFGGGAHHTAVALELFGRLDLAVLYSPAFDGKGWDDGLTALWAGVACHHGKPMEAIGQIQLNCSMQSKGESAAKAYARDVTGLFGPYEPLGPITRHKAEVLSWLVAGLTNLADWIGSNRDAFPYAQPTQSLEGYWPLALKRAADAVAAAGLLPAPSAAAPQLSTLFPSIVEPSHLQAWAQSEALPPGPLLAVVEDVTGSGKTEAAHVLAARLMAADRAGGVFFALPTMATANAMYERLGESYRRMFDVARDPSLVLAHGRSALHKGFSSSILRDVGIADQDADDAEARGDASTAVCATWIADDRRKAFLAHVGVGTIDQAFLGVLPSKHQALRLWGLSDRVLIVDEAHAYDAYMGRELERLLEFHAALGGSAIVLSATLPGSQRAGLAKAFARGLGVAAAPVAETAYPLATLVSAEGVRATPVATRPDRARRLPVRLMPPGNGTLTHVADMVRRGASVAWIRNSVDDAIEAFEALQASGVACPSKLHLLHARFAMGDRLAIETGVREALGKSGTMEGRSGFVVVGTQILQESLDYDVDVMVTDLAPVDMIIQRAGRLWRHAERTAQGRPVVAPELVVVSPDWANVVDRNWYRQVSPRAAAVYKHHGVVWRTAKVLADARAIDTPGGVRDLIEAVYARGDQQNDDVPGPLRQASNAAVGDYRAQVSLANSNLLDPRLGYDGNNTHWTSDTVTPTRLGDPVTVFRLGRVEGGIIVPWCVADDGDPRRSWALSEVSISRRKATGVPKQAVAMEVMIEAAKESWSEWEREQPLLVLDSDGEATGGWIVNKDGRPQPVIYGRRAPGLRIVAPM